MNAINRAVTVVPTHDLALLLVAYPTADGGVTVTALYQGGMFVTLVTITTDGLVDGRLCSAQHLAIAGRGTESGQYAEEIEALVRELRTVRS